MCVEGVPGLRLRHPSQSKVRLWFGATWWVVVYSSDGCLRVEWKMGASYHQLTYLNSCIHDVLFYSIYVYLMFPDDAS